MDDNQEYILTDHDLIMSYTDSKGIITFVNDDFVRITGFSKDEIIGKSHAIIRHSDVPKEIYSDVWKHLLKNRTWTGLIKNKTKHGGFYWVRASITPMYQKGKRIGYMSVHRRPNREHVQAMIPVYAEIKAGISNKKVVNGYVFKNNFFETLLQRLADIKIKHKFLFLASLTSLSLMTFGVADYLDLNTLNTNYYNTIQDFKQDSKTIALARKAQFDFKFSTQESERGQNTSDLATYKNVIQDLEQRELPTTKRYRVLVVASTDPN